MAKRHAPPGSCMRCMHPEAQCRCAQLQALESITQVKLILHCREATRRQATSPFALSALRQSELFIYGERDSSLDLSQLQQPERRWLLLSAHDAAPPLTAELLAQDSRPVTLIVPDGNARQASRAARRIPGLEHVQRVALPRELWGHGLHGGGAFSAWGLSSLEAIAAALQCIESAQLAERLRELFQRDHAWGAGIAASALVTAARSTTAKSTTARSPTAKSDEHIEVLFQDEYLVAVNKPSGVAVHRGWSDDERPLLQQVRDHIGARVYPVHRLDRATSGVVLFALDAQSASALQNQFETEQVTKRYLAVCRGHELRPHTIKHPLAEEKGGPRKDAITEVRVLAQFERYGLVEAIPRTGRTHQIRKHLKHLAHPIIGDVRYGKGEHNRVFRERFGLHRLALHCKALSFQHPDSGVELCLQAPLRGELQQLFQALGWPSE